MVLYKTGEKAPLTGNYRWVKHTEDVVESMSLSLNYFTLHNLVKKSLMCF